jgi:RNA polymerase sigma factor for flagellar operon FliA
MGELGYEPKPDELAYRMGVTEAEIRGWLLDDAATRIKPLTIQVGDQDEEREGSWSAVEDDQVIAAEVAEIRARVMSAVNSLDAREREVLLLYYRDSLTLRQIALQLGLSVSSATTVHTRLVEHIRERLAAFGAVA